jgi:hypothetical protein
MAKPFRIHCNMVPISMNYFNARGTGHQACRSFERCIYLFINHSRTSSIAASSPAINFSVRIAMTLLDSTASNIKGMNISYLQERRHFANNRLIKRNGPESLRAVERTF